MRTIAPDRTYIDYWHRRGYSCSGVRVWQSGCRALASDPDQGPEGLMEYGDYFPIPLSAEIHSRRTGALTQDPAIEREILWHMFCIPGSDLRQLLAGEKSFREALMPAVEPYHQATAGNSS